MKFAKKNTLISPYFLLLLFLSITPLLVAQDARFTVVIDAGHGGHDSGAKGSFAYEKDINLAIALELGTIIDQKYKDVKVVFTRKTDVYLTLQERADVVNNHHADLFICVHTNASPSSAAFGSETYTLGLAKTRSNLDVAMRENSVITLEENYKTKYQGFDPRSVESYIMFEFMQDKYIDRSVDFASNVQKQFRNYCNRADRGVRQAGFWVLHRSACPSVLIEVGFVSNQTEERYLTSESGQHEMAAGIFNAFVDYKRDHDKKSGRQSLPVSKLEQSPRTEQAELKTDNNQKQSQTTVQTQPQVQNQTEAQSGTVVKNQRPTSTLQALAESTTNQEATPTVKPIVKPTVSVPVRGRLVEKTEKTVKSNEPIYKIQLLATPKVLKDGCHEFKGITGVDNFQEDGLNKYTLGADTDYDKVEKIRRGILAKFPHAFIIAFVGDKKMSAKDALKLSK